MESHQSDLNTVFSSSSFSRNRCRLNLPKGGHRQRRAQRLVTPLRRFQSSVTKKKPLQNRNGLKFFK